MKAPSAFTSKGGKGMGTGGVTKLPPQKMSAAKKAQAVGKAPASRGKGC